VWTVKNIFELKNARNVVVEYNVMENHWQEAQPGYAVLFTPRNSGGTCTWCVVENVRFEYNVVRHVAAGINLLGYDDPKRGSKQTQGIVISRNLFADVTRTLGGNGWFMLIGDGPRDITIDHNTIEHDGNTLVYVYGGTAAAPRAIPGMRFTNNAARHGSYGMGGAHFAYGNAILANYFPGAVFAGNYLAGAPASRYPAGTRVAGAFEDEFAGVEANDFRPRAGSTLTAGATDGTAIGCEQPEGWSWVPSVEDGTQDIPITVSRPRPPTNLRIVAG
jgi:hypothetical protein